MRSAAPATRWLLPGLLALGSVGAVAVLFLFDPAQHAFYPTCWFHRLTGWQCPGCGGLRALHELLHGRLGTALRLNPAVVVGLPALIVWAAWAMRLGRFSVQNRPRTRPEIWLWVGFVALLLFGVARNVPPLAGWLG